MEHQAPQMETLTKRAYSLSTRIHNVKRLRLQSLQSNDVDTVEYTMLDPKSIEDVTRMLGYVIECFEDFQGLELFMEHGNNAKVPSI